MVPLQYLKRNEVLGPLTLITVALTAAPECSALDWGGEKPLEHFTTTSPSGAYQLTVSPPYDYGKSPALYRLDQNGQELWSAELPFSLLEAGVTDEGAVAGYGRTRIDKCGKQLERGSEFVVAFMDPLGETVRVNRYPRWLRGKPYGFGLIMDPGNDRAMVRVVEPIQGELGESWWWYTLSTGQGWFKYRPAAAMPDLAGRSYHVVAIRPVAGTGWMLVNWLYFEGEGEHRPAHGRFALLPPGAPPIWSLNLPGDYSHANEYIQWDIVNYIREHGAILRTDEPMHFDIHLVADHKRVSFGIERAGECAWTVKEIARSDHRIPKHFLRRVGPPSAGEEEPQGAD